VNTPIATPQERAKRCRTQVEVYRAILILGRSHEYRVAALNAGVTVRDGKSLAERHAELTTELEQNFDALVKRLAELAR
jgi:hypothetical protein